MTYAESLKHPLWQKRRLEIMNRDGFRCQECGSVDRTLNVHHKLYLKRRKPWEYGNEILVTLCEDCHRDREDAVTLLMVSILSASTRQISQIATGILQVFECDGSVQDVIPAIWEASGLNPSEEARERIQTEQAKVLFDSLRQAVGSEQQ